MIRTFLLNLFIFGFVAFIHAQKVNFFHSKNDEARKRNLAFLHKDGKRVLCDTTGEIILDKAFSSLKYLGAGLIKTQKKWSFGLINAQGKEILPPLYNRIRYSPKGIFVVTTNGIYDYDTNNKFLIDSTGRRPFSELYDGYILNYNSSNFIGIRENQKFALANLNGKIITDFVFNSLKPIKENAIIVSVENKGECLIDTTGKIISPFYDYIDWEKPKRDWAYVRNNNNSETGVISFSGEELIPPIYQNFSTSENYFVAKRNDKFGLIDIENNIKIPIVHDYNFYYEEGLVWDSNEKLFDIFGKPLLPDEYESAEETEHGSFFYVYENGKMGVFDVLKFKPIVPSIYDDCFIFLSSKNEYYFSVKLGDKMAVVDIKGHQIIPFQKAESITYCKDGYFLIRNENLLTILNNQGKKIWSEKGKSIWIYSKDAFLFREKKDSKIRILNKKGKNQSNEEFSKIYYLNQRKRKLYLPNSLPVKISQKAEFLVFSENKGWSIRDKKGKSLPTTFSKKSSYYPYKEGQKWGVKDQQNRIVLSPKFYWIYEINDSLILGSTQRTYLNLSVFDLTEARFLNTENIEENYLSRNPFIVFKKGKKYAIQSRDKTFKSDYIYDEIGYWDKESDLTPVVTNNQIGFINSKGKIVIPFDYEIDLTNGLSSEFHHGIAVVKKGLYFGIIDTQGNIIRPFEYEIALSEFRYNDEILLKKGDKWEVLNRSELTKKKRKE